MPTRIQQGRTHKTFMKRLKRLHTTISQSDSIMWLGQRQCTQTTFSSSNRPEPGVLWISCVATAELQTMIYKDSLDSKKTQILRNHQSSILQNTLLPHCANHGPSCMRCANCCCCCCLSSPGLLTYPRHMGAPQLQASRSLLENLCSGMSSTTKQVKAWTG